MKSCLLFIVLVLLMSEFVNGQINYVTSAGGGLKDGTDWANAYDNTQLQQAIDQAEELGYTEVWVAAGTYKPGTLVTHYFNMRSGVAIYGGFAGTEATREARNWVTNVTILSGELGDPGIKTDNSYYVIYNSGIDNTAILDGFTIRDGYNGIGWGDSGGGISNHASSPTLNNLIITHNTGSFGGGLYNTDSSSPTLTNCTITNNFARRGGGVCNNGSSPTFINCMISNNSASINAGGIFNEGTGNTMTLINCTIAGNTASTYGGGIFNDVSSMVLQNSIIWGNSATLGSSQVYIESGSITLDYCCYADGTMNVGGNPNSGGVFTATNSTVADPRFVSSNGFEYLIAGTSPCADAGLDSFNSQNFDLRGAGFERKLNKSDASTGTIDMGAYEYKFGTDPAGGTTYTWTGTADNNWNNADNWSTATVPTSADGASFVESSPNYPVITATFECYDLTIAQSATLTIATSGALTVTNSLTNNGRIIIQSDASGTGSLIAGASTGTGTATAQKYLPANAWTMFSSPLAGQTIASFLTSPLNLTTIQTDGTNRGMMDFNPVTNTWNSFFTNETPGTLAPGKGFSVRLQGDADAAVLFTGSIQAGPISVPTAMNQWNSVGNPYTSAIGMTSSATTADNFLTRNASNLDPYYGVYIWDRSEGGNELTGPYKAISNVPSPTTAGFEFQPGQAFMVKMRERVDAVSFNKSMQIHNPEMEEKPAPEDWAIIQLNATVNNLKSSAIIGFSGDMTDGLDPTYDAGLFKGPSQLALYSYLLTSDSIPFAIQALPDNSYDYMIIPLGLDSETGGEVVFSADFFNLPSQGHAILQDLQTSTFTDLAGEDYTATIEPNSSITDRFRLHTSYLTVTAVDEKTQAGQLKAYPVRNTQIRLEGSVSRLAVATLYDIQGKVVLVKNLEEGILNTIPTPNLKSGIYLLSVIDNKQVQRFKIPVSQ